VCRASRGFTLIELIVVIAIVGLLSAVAYPAYMEYVKKARRAEVAGLLSETAHTLERFYSRHGQYSDVTGSPVATPDIPAGNAHYRITAERASGQAFTLIAEPIAGALMAADKCGTFVTDHTGWRDNRDLTDGATALWCWSR